MISLVFIRHGATKGNLEKRYIGRTDEPLCDTGVAQALKLREHSFPREHVFVSPMKRTRQTAELIFPESKYVIEESFKEMDFGIFEGKTAFELSENEEYRRWVDSMCTLPVPNGESVADFKKRCVDAFAKAVKSIRDNSGASFVIHGGVIMAILEAFSDPKADFYHFHIKNGEFLVCKFEDGKIRL
ncbi:MAG: histidine phosphatase family protein [Clostridia bacterium]|nr:histidine phosphatase family protein [Clostridia bacterium]